MSSHRSLAASRLFSKPAQRPEYSLRSVLHPQAGALASEYDAPEEEILGDVLGVLRLLAEKNFLEVSDGEP